MTNDHAWEREVLAVLGVPVNHTEKWFNAASYEGAQAWYRSINGLDLHYVSNSRIMSAWIGGPHGWLDWDGNVGCSTWNIGKWPSLEAVTEDFTAIAAAFPYLNFHAQLITNGGDEETGEVAAQYRVIGGVAALVEPIERFTVSDPPFTFLIRGGERGVSTSRLREATAQLRGASS
jgi:hypothetical protein